MDKPKQARSNIFSGGYKAVNVAVDIFRKVKADAEKEGLYPAQVVNRILRNHYERKTKNGKKRIIPGVVKS